MEQVESATASLYSEEGLGASHMVGKSKEPRRCGRWEDICLKKQAPEGKQAGQEERLTVCVERCAGEIRVLIERAARCVFGIDAGPRLMSGSSLGQFGAVWGSWGSVSRQQWREQL
jgi:hypothetical protein